MPHIATLTLNPAIDKNCVIDQVVPERKLRCHQVQYDPGGGGINVARAIHELGGEVTAYWAGGGATGELLNTLLDQAGIDHVRLPIEGWTRENLIVYEESSGQQFRFGMPGATLTLSEIEMCKARLNDQDPPPDYFILSGSLPPDVEPDLYARIAESLPASCRIILDTSGQAFQLGLESRLFLIKPNIRELGELVGKPIEDDSQIREVAQSLIKQGNIEVVITSLGSGGVVLTTANEFQHIRAPTVKIRSKVGAGDSTVAGIVHALAQGRSLQDAVRFGVAAGSAAVMSDGTKLCRREDTERLYARLTM